ncbi:MAG: ParB domain protein nuclease [Thermoleophilia bacterium]|nr:ParB domain protein nuclease [Thermoleophilia bacterium]
MGDVDDLQAAEEAAAQRAEAKAERQREARAKELRIEPQRPGLAIRTRVTRELPITQLHPGENIRLDLPEIQELALSIREVGLLTPLLVRPWNPDKDADGTLPKGADPSLDHYRLVAGHRRHAALTALVDAEVDGFDIAACEVREGISEAEAYALMLTENVQRVALEPIQAARALRLLLDLNEGMDAATLARSLGLRSAWATTHLKLLDLPQEVQDRLEAGDLSVTIADILRKGQAMGRIDEAKVKELAEKVASGEITSTQVRKEAGPAPKNTQAPRTVEMGPDGKPLDPALSAGGTWQDLSEGSVRGDLTRPATPLSNRENPYAPGEVIERVPGMKSAEAAAAVSGPKPASAPVIPYEDRLDAYLLGRALREWASDEYLDDLGIDRVQADAYAMMLGFEERIAAIRHVSATLMEQESAGLVPA